ncbi:MAG: thioredoxin family protein [Deltaproteobacteria bacterium]|nr:thioredoxin family protein [Deltaproteobacteria bacterium]
MKTNSVMLSLLAVAAFVVTTLSTFGQVPVDNVLRDFELTGDYSLEVGGQAQPKAKIYQSRTAGAFLLRTSVFETPVMLSPRSGAVETVSLMSLSQQPDGSVDILADAEVLKAGVFRLEGTDVFFSVSGQEAKLSPKPPLTGLKDAAQLLDYSPEYVLKASSYQPGAADVAALRERSDEVKVKVFFGSWCAFCKTYVPRMLKVDQALEGSKVSVEYYGVPKPPFNDEPEVQKFKIGGVPTGIVYVGGQEVGRIEKQMWMQPEKTLLNMLSGS